MLSSDPIPPDILNLLEDRSFAANLPPMGNGAKQLLAFKVDDQEDPRLLALVAQKDPVHLGRILSLANSAAHYMPGTPITTAEAAVRRLGVRDTYLVLVACAMSASFPEQPDMRVQRRNLLNYTVSVCLTAKKLATWLRVDETRAAYLSLGALLTCTGLYAGMLAGGPVADRFKLGLADKSAGADFRMQSSLKGFYFLSEQVARNWHAPKEVLAALRDLGGETPKTDSGSLLGTVEALVYAKAQGQNQWAVIQAMAARPLMAGSGAEFSELDIGVYVG